VPGSVPDRPTAEGAQHLDTLLAYKAIAIVAGLSASDRRVAGAILDHFNHKDGRCDPGIERLADLLDLHIRTVLRAVDELDRRGLILKDRHGGRSLRNNYEPNWSKFREIEAEWKTRFNANKTKSAATGLSAGTRQEGHRTGDGTVTQTFLSNLSPEPVNGQAGKEKEQHRDFSTSRAPVRMWSQSSSASWRSAAERQWNNELHRLYGRDADIYGAIIDAIDEPLRNATTDIEMRKVGAGVPFLVDQLRKREIEKPPR
jgi:predicted transcriptional regulator